MKRFITISVVASCSLFALEAFACDGFNGSNKFASSRGGNNFNSFASVGRNTGINYQYAAMKAAQRNARLKPLRIANAQRIREREMIAYRQRVDARIAARELRQREALEESGEQMLADSREWTDITGNHTTRAKLLASNSQAVQLLKTDGSKVVVPLSRLSMTDRDWLASQEIPVQPDVLLASR